MTIKEMTSWLFPFRCVPFSMVRGVGVEGELGRRKGGELISPGGLTFYNPIQYSSSTPLENSQSHSL